MNLDVMHCYLTGYYTKASRICAMNDFNYVNSECLSRSNGL